MNLNISQPALEHLGEVMHGETAPPLADDPCIYCVEIRRAIDRALSESKMRNPVAELSDPD